MSCHLVCYNNSAPFDRSNSGSSNKGKEELEIERRIVIISLFSLLLLSCSLPLDVYLRIGVHAQPLGGQCHRVGDTHVGLSIFPFITPARVNASTIKLSDDRMSL